MSYNFDKITAKIFIKKTKFFGLYKKYAVIIILPSLKIAKVKTNIKNIPFIEKGDLCLGELHSFVRRNDFTITYNTNNKILKRLLTILI
jgi:hypothetical protein